MASKIRCTIAENLKPANSKVLLFQSNTGLKDFLAQATEKLGLGSPAKKLYLEDGGEIDDVSAIRDSDLVYVSCGEQFFGKAKQSASNQCPVYSIAVMGPGAVGKSAMTLQFVQGVFVVDYDPTIEDAYRKNAVVDGDACVLDILDTAGQEDYTALRSTWMRERDGFLLVFNVTDRSTFDDLQGFYDQLAVMHEEGVPPLVIAGNKSDIVNKRVVTVDEGNKLAEQYRAAGYFDTSAKTGLNIEKVFTTLVREMRKKAPARKQPVKDKSWSWCSLL